MTEPLPQYRILDTVAEALTDQQLKWVKHMVGEAIKDFEELQGTTITVGQIPDTDFAYARAFVTNRIIMVPTDHRPDWDVVYHEIAHVAIKVLSELGEDVPTSSEEYCSIYATTKIDPEQIERDGVMYLGEPTVPKEQWPEICERALEYRENNRDYIQQCKRWLGIIDS